MKSRVQPRWILLSILAVALAVCVVAAGVRTLHSFEKEKSAPQADALAVKMVRELGYSEAYTQVPAASVQKYYPVDADLLAGAGMWLAKGSDKAGELCCFQLRRAADAPAVKKAVAERLSSKAQALRAVNVAQYRMVQNAVVVQQGQYVLVAVSADSTVEKELFYKLLK
ncbi:MULTISPECIES: DUF4358 domain-containing protein [Caproicibacterium]|uniref:DUF4358 domain-containing protein n=1 Tax=Caproicibacterium argilliputei TaxID=3030016 RepID=A0AA97DC97_9FIRM|nr:DUF4358 domain-containing protein [Caproicibacterium argilliputei]WOC33164.1 DUF4358 domain-containing protein [Caproicibacterium argilliputei]